MSFLKFTQNLSLVIARVAFSQHFSHKQIAFIHMIDYSELPIKMLDMVGGKTKGKLIPG